MAAHITATENRTAGHGEKGHAIHADPGPCVRAVEPEAVFFFPPWRRTRLLAFFPPGPLPAAPSSRRAGGQPRGRYCPCLPTAANLEGRSWSGSYKHNIPLAGLATAAADGKARGEGGRWRDRSAPSAPPHDDVLYGGLTGRRESNAAASVVAMIWMG